MFETVKRWLGHPYFLWAVLTVPALPMVSGLASGSAPPEHLLFPTGEYAARFLIVAMMLTPLRMLFPKTRWLRWLAARRRAIGVAAFGYAALHTALYIIDMGTLRSILAEFLALGIWTGWAAFAIFLPLAVTSNEWAMRVTGRGWTTLHRFAYAAALLTLLHWMFVHNGFAEALANFAPLAALELYRIVKLMRLRSPATAG